MNAIIALTLLAAPPADAWITGYDKSLLPKAAEQKPALNQPFEDPVHGLSVRRISEPNEFSEGWIRHEHSRRQPFNADDSRLVMTGNDGTWHLYSVADKGAVRWMDKLPRLTEPTWHPTDPKRLRYFPRENPRQLVELKLPDREPKVLADFTDRLPWENVVYVNTRGEGEPSADGRIWCLMASDDRYKPVGLFSYDLEKDEVLATEAVTVTVDHISTAPSGSHCIPSGMGLEGTWAYQADDFSKRHKLNDRSEHSDVAIGADGQDLLVYTNYSRGWITMVDVASGETTQLVRIHEKTGATFAAHISGNAYAHPGFVVVSTFAAKLEYGKTPADYGDLWGHDRLALVELRAEPTIYNVAYMRNARTDQWSEPHAASNRDLTRIVFASNWGEGHPDAYLVTLSPPAFED